MIKYKTNKEINIMKIKISNILRGMFLVKKTIYLMKDIIIKWTKLKKIIINICKIKEVIYNMIKWKTIIKINIITI
jgi:hypothetical protein